MTIPPAEGFTPTVAQQEAMAGIPDQRGGR